jgi:molybdopterin/thiamine biosynthesis adenylyltransferase
MSSRYSRQMLVLGGGESQQILTNASVCVVGAGGIGSSVILYLAAAGVGNLRVVDDDVVEESNLHRQVIHDCDTLGCLHI